MSEDEDEIGFYHDLYFSKIREQEVAQDLKGSSSLNGNGILPRRD